MVQHSSGEDMSVTRTTAHVYWFTFAATLAFFVGFYALLVPLPRYLTAISLADWQVGFVLGAFGVASLIGRPIAGVASDRLGPRRVMLAGAASLAIGALGVGFSTNLAVLFALRMLQAGGYVAFTTAGTALVVSLVAEAERARRLAVFGAAANLAISLTPAAASAVLEIASLQWGFFMSAAFAALGGGIALILVPSGGQVAGAVAQQQWTIPRRLWLPMLATALLGAGFAAFFQFAPILAERRAISAGVLYTVYGAAIIATRLFGGPLLDRLDVSRVVLVAALIMLLAQVLLAIGESVPPLLVGAAGVAISGGLFHPALIARHAALLPEAPGRASAAFYVAFDLGIGVGSWILGLALQLAGVSGLYWTAAGLAVIAVVLSPALRARRVTADQHASGAPLAGTL
ncbi:MAG: MFS transporter [Chloroflexi bacterium]|nr:MFS transporter [Chloroflexota bacterium]